MTFDNLDDHWQEQAFALYLASKRGDEPFTPGEVSAIQRAIERDTQLGPEVSPEVSPEF